MRTSLKVILAGVGIAVLTCPVMAETPSRANRNPHRTTGETFPLVQDCVRTPFPQCGGNWRRTKHHRHHHEVRADQ